MVKAEQFINLDDACGVTAVIHEIGHTIGLWHEQSRPDRDEFITVLAENINPAMLYNFDERPGAICIGYDYDSIMHYGRFAFSVNGRPTIETIPPGIPIGQQNGLSPGDIASVARLYSDDCPFRVEEVTLEAPSWFVDHWDYNYKAILTIVFNRAVDMSTVVARETMRISLSKSGLAVTNIAGRVVSETGGDQTTIFFISDEDFSDLLNPQAAENYHYEVRLSGNDSGSGVITDLTDQVLDGDDDKEPGGDFLQDFLVVG